MNLTPREIVEELDKYIIGQNEAKRAVAVALRNRYRRSKLSKELREDITPKNIILKGPTGVGKTEIARRLARLVKAPFVKIEATKYTEVGYVGRDVESMVRDLVEVAVRMVKDEKKQEIEYKVKPIVDKKLIEAIKKVKEKETSNVTVDGMVLVDFESGYHNGEFEDTVIEIDVKEQPKQMNFMEGMSAINLGDMFSGFMPNRKKNKHISVKHARELLFAEEYDKHIDHENVCSEAIRRAEEEGIIFIDEMDKVIGKSASGHGPDVSREGVQRDLLPIVEGSTVSTKYGPIRTDFILFIAAGAFHLSKIEDLIPELQGRFPTTVALSNITYEDFVKILSDTENSLILQYTSLLGVDNIKLDFTKDGIEEIARIAVLANETNENIGARRLHSIMESLLEDVSFNATGDHPVIVITIDKKYVDEHLSNICKKFDLSKYIL